MDQEFSDYPFAPTHSLIYYIMPQLCFDKLQHVLEHSPVKKQGLPKQLQHQLKEIYAEFIDQHSLSYRNCHMKRLEEISRVRPIQDILIAPEIKKKTEWRILDETEWATIEENVPDFQYKIPMIFQKQDLNCYFQEEFIQISIIFYHCQLSKAFYGFVPRKTTIQEIVCTLGSELGYSNFQKAQVQIINEVNILSLEELAIFKVQDLKQNPITIRNLNLKAEDPSSMAAQQSYPAQDFLEEPNQEPMSDSTGVECEGVGERMLRIRIFSAKQESEINEMKKKYFEIIQGPKIPLPEADEIEMGKMLQEIAKQSMNLNWH